MSIAYVNGNYIHQEKASISIFDRGFLFADSIYEVLPVYNGQVWFLDKHLQRLHYSLSETHIQCELGDNDLKCIFKELINQNNIKNGQIYLQITRGNTYYRNHDIQAKMRASVIAFTMELPYLSLEQAQKGLHAITLDDIRWLRCDIKSTVLLANILLNDQAVSHGADTTLLLRNNYLTESAAANVFIVNDKNQILTPIKDNRCLPGITRDLIVNLAKKAHLSVLEKNISEQELYNAKEIMITSTTKEIQPVTKLNDKMIGDGKAGATWRILFELFQKLKTTHG